MSTLAQLCLRTSHKNFGNHTKTPDLSRCPQRRAQCLKVTVRKPKKPNSAQRKIARVQLSKGGRRIWIYVPGIGHTLQQHSWVLIRGGRVRDLPGIKYKAIRGKLDFLVETSITRGSRRSKYGFKRKQDKH